MDFTLNKKPTVQIEIEDLASFDKIFNEVQGLSEDEIEVLKQQVKNLQLDLASLRSMTYNGASLTPTEFINIGIALAVWSIKNGQVTVD